MKPIKLTMLIVLQLFFLISYGQKKQDISQINIKTNQTMERDIKFLRMAIDMAKESQSKGNLPYGCILVSKDGTVLLKGENTINTDQDCLAHAEINLIREACKIYDHEFLKTTTIYTSDEPCPMCSSAIFWSGMGKLTYGLSKDRYYDIVGKDNPDWVFEMSAREVLKSGKRKVEVTGPFLESEVEKLHTQ